MKKYVWSKEKNEWLKLNRKISFDKVTAVIEKKNKVIAIIDHPNQFRYPGQRMFIVEVNNYCYTVPFVEDKDKIFFKTIYPSRKATKKYIKNKKGVYEK